MRYFAELAYNGQAYFGWQRQPEQVSVQSTIEEALSTILNTPLEITGCGRTDTGVHARQYFIHFDLEGAFPENFLLRLNKFLPADIAFRRIFEVKADAHARYDAYYRSYEYHIDVFKNPFELGTSHYFPFTRDLDFSKMEEAAALLLQYEEFFPFCKTNTDVKTMRCELFRSEWAFDHAKGHHVYHISANRFLRGMVRLIVGMCLYVGQGKMSLAEVRTALDQQARLPKSWSIPPDGLYLTDVRYPFL
jgi:tRNA pseudouridine38-40 synthase